MFIDSSTDINRILFHYSSEDLKQLKLDPFQLVSLNSSSGLLETVLYDTEEKPSRITANYNKHTCLVLLKKLESLGCPFEAPNDTCF